MPEEILTDNGKVFTGRFNKPAVEVLFDRILRENGVKHRLTQPRSPTTTGKVERFHRALRSEFRTDRVFTDLATAQAELDEWVRYYNTERPHQAIGMIVPAERFEQRPMGATRESAPLRLPAPGADRAGDGLGGAAGRRQRGGQRELAAGLSRRGRGRAQHRCPGRGRGAAVLGRRCAAQDRAPRRNRTGPETPGLDPGVAI